MTTVEFDLLAALCQNPGRILSRDQLVELTRGRIWRGRLSAASTSIISRIRQKIEPDPRDPTLIKTVRLGGYIFTPLVSEA